MDGSAGEVVVSTGSGAWVEAGERAVLVELWRAGGSAEGEDLALPIGISPGPGGRIAIPDFSLGEVVVVERDGSWRGSMTRVGEGPGEVRAPVAASWDEHGHLVVFDVVNAKVAFLDEQGNVAHPDLPVPTALTAPVVASGQLDGGLVAADGTAYVLPGVAAGTPAAGSGLLPSLLLRARPGSATADTVLRVVVPTVVADGYAPIPVRGAHRVLADIGPDGTFARGGATGDYLIRVETPDSPAVILQLCREVEPLPLRARERGEDDGSAADVLTALDAAPEPAALPAYGRIIAGKSGVVWVQRERPSAFPVHPSEALHGVPGASYDVYDATGHFLGTVRAPERARIQAVAGDTVWALAFDDLDVPTVIAFRLDVR